MQKLIEFIFLCGGIWLAYLLVRRIWRVFLSYVAVTIVTVNDDIEQIHRNRSEPTP